MLGEGAVIDQGGHLGEISLHRLKGGAGGDRLPVLLGGGQPGLHGGHVLRMEGAAVQLELERLEGGGQLPGRRRQAPQGLPALVGADALGPGTPGHGHGVVPRLGEEGGGLLQLHVAVGQLPQGGLGGQGLGVGLGAQGGEQGRGGSVGHLL